MRLRSKCGGCERVGSPPMCTSPDVGSSSRFVIFSVVVLPEPESPTIATNCRAGTARSTERTARCAP
jgi:hypothetical protein